jgi:hypothetical protein
MKKFVKYSLFFALFFTLFTIVINTVYLGIIASTDWDFVKRRESLKFKNPDFKLLVLGSSLAEYGIDTELLTNQGIKSFNLSLVGSSVKTYYVQLDEYLSKYSKKPEYVLIAVNSYMEQFDQIGIQPVVDFTMKDHKYGLKDIPISKFNWAGMEIVKKILKRKYNKAYVSYGQKKTIEIVPDNSQYNNDLSLDIEKFESAYWMGEIAKLCNEHRINLIIADIPGIKETQNLSGIGPYKLNFSNGHSVFMYNFNNQEFCKFIDVDLDWCGRSHLNKFGAAKFTSEIVNIIPLNEDVSRNNF